jgi:hypothetical protein
VPLPVACLSNANGSHVFCAIPKLKATSPIVAIDTCCTSPSGVANAFDGFETFCTWFGWWSNIASKSGSGHLLYLSQ